MTTQRTVQRPIATGVRVAPSIVVAIAVLAFIAGLGLARLVPASAPAHAAAVQAAPSFDSVGFRAGERDSWRPASTFDSVGFRAQERDSWRPAPTFDAVRFRAEERRP